MEEVQHRAAELRILRSVIESAFRRWRLILGTVAAVMLLTLAFTFLPSKQYQSQMKLLIQNARSSSVITASNTTALPSSDVTEQQINSEMEVLQSQDVLGAVADPSWDPAKSATRPQKDVALHDQKITTLTKHLTFDVARKSNVIEVVALAKTPQEAANTLNQLISAYMAQRKLLSRPGGATSFFAEEANRYFSEWQQANGDLISFQQQNHLVSVPEMENGIKKDMDTLDSQLIGTETGLAESQRKLQEINRALKVVPARQSTQQRSIPNQFSVEQMQTMLVTLNNKRTELITRYQPTDRLVTELDRQIADTTDALARANERRAEESTTDVSPVWQQLQTNLSLERVNQQALQGRVSSINISKSALQGQLAGAQQLAVQYDDLKARAEQAQNNYKTFAEKHDQAQIEDAMDEHKLVNVAVAESPTTSYRAFSPRPLQNLVLGLLTSLFLAAGLVYLAELLRSTIANIYELEAFTAKPVLASLPLLTSLQKSAPFRPSVSSAYPESNQASDLSREHEALSSILQK